MDLEARRRACVELAAAIDPAVRRRTCVAFRVKLSQDTGVNLPAAACEGLLNLTVGHEGEIANLESNPGQFYTGLGEAIGDQSIALFSLGSEAADAQRSKEVAAWCFREAAEVHTYPGAMLKLFGCLETGRGVTEDPVQAAVWLEKAADLGDADSKSLFGSMLVDGNARSGVVNDAARGFALLCEAFAQGSGTALLKVAECYLKGEGVAKDGAHAVTLLRQVTDHGGVDAMFAKAKLAGCYWAGNGVEADTVQAAVWCQRAADGGSAFAIDLLTTIRKCDFCGTTPARKHCERCRKVRYCDVGCQAAHWNRVTDPHKGLCRRAAQASQGGETGGASTSAQ